MSDNNRLLLRELHKECRSSRCREQSLPLMWRQITQGRNKFGWMFKTKARVRLCFRGCRCGREVCYGAASLIWQAGSCPPSVRQDSLRSHPLGFCQYSRDVPATHRGAGKTGWRVSTAGCSAHCSPLHATGISVKKHTRTRKISPSLHHVSSHLH